jgi:hypothetical protein
MADNDVFPRPGLTTYSAVGEEPRRSHCEFCGRELTPQQAVSSGICDSPECDAKKIEKVGAELIAHRRRQHEERMQAIIADAGTHVDAALAALDGSRETVTIATLPWQNRPVEPLPEARRAAFRAHLEEMAEFAFAAVAGPPEDADPEARARQENPESPMVAAGCGTCQGYCCARGGNTALLLPTDLARYRRRHPESTRAEVIEAYLSHLPATSTRDGCVYQAETGCNLPRAMRQDICNAYYCDSLRWLTRDYSAKGSGKAVLVAADDERRPRRVAMFDSDKGCRRIADLPKAGAVRP